MDSQNLLEYLEDPALVEATSKCSRLVNKLKLAIINRELYETHQIIKTINFRLLNQPNSLPALQELLYRASILFFENQEIVSGQDVGVLLIEANAKRMRILRGSNEDNPPPELANNSYSHHKNQKSIDWDISQKIAIIATHLPDTEVGLRKFMSDAFRLLTPKLLNRSILHESLANHSWKRKDYHNSRYNYLFCANLENAKEIAHLLVEIQASDENKFEVDLFLAQFIFQFICLQNPLDPQPAQGASSVSNNRRSSNSLNGVCRRTRASIKNIAEKIFTSYILEHPELSHESVPYTSHPLLNFTHFVISILSSSQDLESFAILRDIYKDNLSRDPNYDVYLTRIGHDYFGIPDTSRGPNNIFNSLFQSIFEGAVELDDSFPAHEDASSVDDLD